MKSEIRLFDMRAASIDAEHKFTLKRNVTQLTSYAYRRTRWNYGFMYTTFPLNQNTKPKIDLWEPIYP
jgi:hypothetical protein